MSHSVYSTLLPVSIFCTVFGFFTADFANKIVRTSQRVYCSAVTVLAFVLGATGLFVRLSTVQVDNVSFMFLVGYPLVLLIITYYRIKCGCDENAVSNILNDLNYADKCFQSIGVNAVRTRDYIIYFAYLLLTTINGFIILCMFMRNVAPSTNINRKLIAQFDSGFLIYEHLFLSYSYTAIIDYHYAILYNIKIRVNVLLQTVAKPTTLSACSAGEFTRIEQHQFCNKLHSIFYSLMDAYHSTTDFFNEIFHLHIFLIIFSQSLYILYSTSQTSHFHLIFNTVNMLVKQILPLCLPNCIVSEFYNIRRSINNIQEENIGSSVHTALKKINYRFIFSEITYEYGGYFTVDMSLICFIFDFVTLIVFAMI